MATQYHCGTLRRRQAVALSAAINGIDYLEVSPDQRTLRVHFVHALPGQPGGIPSGAPALTRDNVVISGGVRVTNIRVAAVSASGDVLAVAVNAPGDFSPYRLRLAAAPGEAAPPAGFDAQLVEVGFSFKVDCPSDFDCAPNEECPSPLVPGPQIDYLARDYASLRRLMLDRLAVIMPDWKERNPADLGVALVEVLAYAGDALSYYQDAVATEAYLGTARKRVSIRRHARLVDYRMHDGMNARAWVACAAQPGTVADGAVIPGPTTDAPGTLVFTSVGGLPPVLEPRDIDAGVATETEPFETMHDLTLRAANNEIAFYTWGDEECCLPAGATRAALQRNNDRGLVQIAPGAVLIFEEVRGPAGEAWDADRTHRHAVRLTDVQQSEDPLPIPGNPPPPVPLLEIQWPAEDALPFPLCISRGGQAVAVARGNVVLVDHGRTIAGEDLPDVLDAGVYRPRLRFGPLTQQGRVRDRNNRLVLFDPDGPAASALDGEVHDARPAIQLRETAHADVLWQPQRDLLNSDRFASEFVVETEDDGTASLRFGDGVLGREPVSGLAATYRIGNGRAGNVGADAITRIMLDPARVAGAAQMRDYLTLRNPLAAQGGTDPESTDQVRLYVPQAFRVQQRAVTEADYAEVAARHPDVQRAAATRRWTGSWYTMFVAIDRRRGLPVDAGFKDDLRAFLDRFRMAGHDLEIEGPQFVPLDIALTVCVAPGHFRSNVRQVLLQAFSNADLPDGTRGFFHPDNFTFGQPVYLSQILATAMRVPGVSWVDTDPERTRFQRWGRLPQGELAAGRIALGRLAIARLDNSPNEPENGKIEFAMVGGL